MRSARSLCQPEAAVEIDVWRGDLRQLAPAWRAVADAAHEGAPFRSYAWCAAWWKTFSRGREPFVLVGRRAGEAVGLLPLYQEPSPLGGRRLAFIGEGIVGSDYLGLVCRGQDAALLAPRFADALLAQAFDALDLDGLVSGDPLLAALLDRLPPARFVLEPRYRCPHVCTRGDFAAYASALPDGTFQQWKRRLRWLERQPGFRIVEHRDPKAVDAALSSLFALHQARWAEEGGSDAIDSPAVESFHRQAARALAEDGWARVYELVVDGAPRATLYGFSHGDRFSFYQAGYDPAWRQRSVGTVLLGEIIRRVFADGVGEFDFLRGTESYKLSWANGFRQTVRLRAHDGSARGHIHFAGRAAYWFLRHAGKRAVPARALDWARRQRKRIARQAG